MIYKNKRELISAAVRKTNSVLDIGFWGQGITLDNPRWPHNALKKSANEVYGIDLEFDETQFPTPHYIKASAEDFDFPKKFDVIFAGDLIEHLSNPGLFLQSCKRNLAKNGRVIISTPNVFNLFNMASKLTRYEPIVNKDETTYFSFRLLRQLAGKNGFKVISYDYVYDLEYGFKESLKKKVLNVIYRFLTLFTDKFVETLVVTLQAAS